MVRKMNKSIIKDKIQSNPGILKAYGVKSLRVFGSVVREEGRPDSDVDILVEFGPDAEIGLFEFVELKIALSDLLGVPVDLVTPDALHPALKDDILREALYVA